MRLLALDLSTRFGWALPGVNGEPISGSVRLLRDDEIVGVDHGPIFAKLWKWLDDAKAVHGFEGVIFEAPILKGGESFEKTYLLMGLAITTELWCELNHIRVWKGHVNTVRMTVIGDGRATKDDVLIWCAQRRWHPVDDNAGDALVLWEYWDPEVNKRKRRPQLDGFL